MNSGTWSGADLRRTVVIGTSCAGKTTLARQIAQLLGQPHIELDELFWGPQWQAANPAEFRDRILAATAPDAWVLDGNYRLAQELAWPRATALVWLDYPFPLVMWRALRRTIRRVWTGEKLFAGNQETFRDQFLSRESILWWVVTTHVPRRRRLMELIDCKAFPDAQPFVLRNPTETHRFVHGISKNG